MLRMAMLSSACQSQWSVCGTAVKRQRKAEGSYGQASAARQWGSRPNGVRAFLARFRKLVRKAETLLPARVVDDANGFVLGHGIMQVGTRGLRFRQPETRTPGVAGLRLRLGAPRPGQKQETRPGPRRDGLLKKGRLSTRERTRAQDALRREVGDQRAGERQTEPGPARRSEAVRACAPHPQGWAGPLRPQAAGFLNCAGSGTRLR